MSKLISLELIVFCLFYLNILTSQTIQIKDKSVIVCVWSNGVDISSINKENLWFNPDEIFDGVDNDKNGCVDDINGICFNLDGSASNVLFDYISFDSTKIKELDGLINNPGISEAKCKSYVNQREQEIYKLKLTLLRKDFSEDLGTFAANIIVKENPDVKILSVKNGNDISVLKNSDYSKNLFNSSEYETREEHLKKLDAALFQITYIKPAERIKQVGRYLRSKKVKVVNFQINIPTAFEVKMLVGKGKNELEISELSTQISNAWHSALNDCIGLSPDILFVTTANNPSDDPYYKERFPNGYNFPNLLTIGSTDGKEIPSDTQTKFDSINPFLSKNIDSNLIKNNFATQKSISTLKEQYETLKNDFNSAKSSLKNNSSIDVYVKDISIEAIATRGIKKIYSHALLAAPQVTNLAAKILSLKSGLTPVELKELIIKNSDKNSDGLLFINQKKTLEDITQKK